MFKIQDRVQGPYGPGVVIKCNPKLDKGEASYDVRFDQNGGSHYTAVPESLLTKLGTEKLENYTRVGDVIICEQGLGIVRFAGEIQPWDETVLGVELKDSSQVDPRGNTNGTWNGVTYFTCPDNAGVFVTQEDIKRVVTSEEILLRCAQLNTVKINLRAELGTLRKKAR